MPKHNRALLVLDEEALHMILHLPDGVRIVGVRDDFMHNGVMVMLEGDYFPTTAEGTEPWRVPTRLTVSNDNTVTVKFDIPEV